MKNISDVLRQKEHAISLLQKEIELLRAAAELLSEDSDETAHSLPRGGGERNALSSGARQNGVASPANAVNYHASPEHRPPQFP